MESQQLSDQVAALAADRKALDVRCIDVRAHCTYTDFLVIASGTSDRHVRSIAELVEGSLRAAGVRSLGHEGLREARWALVDFGDVVLHVFDAESRAAYRLEDIFGDAPSRAVEPSRAEGQYPPPCTTASSTWAAAAPTLCVPQPKPIRSA